MSVRAYRVISIDTEGSPTFNLWHDDEVVELLGVSDKGALNDDGCGLIEFSVSEIDDALKRAHHTDTIVVLTRMRKDAKTNGGWAQYYCF